MAGVEMMVDVARALRGLAGCRATVEYPGFVQVENPDGTLWNVGTADGDWGGDLSDACGNYLGEAFLIEGSAGWDDPVRVAQEVLARVMPGGRGDGK